MIGIRKTAVASNLSLLGLFAIGMMLLLGSAISVGACICGKASTCERFNFHKTIFIGKAIGIETAQNGTFKTESTVFEIKEMFSGDKTHTVIVKNKTGFDCNVQFTVGETYLVFAAGDKQDGFGTGYCSGNLPFEFATEEISELRKMSGSTGDGRLIGKVLEESTKRTRDEQRLPIKDVRIEITELATGRKYATRTDVDGRYEIAVPPGEYGVTPIAPSNSFLKSLFESEPMKVRSGGCAAGFFVLANENLVTGRLLDSGGKPVPYVRVELLSMDEKNSYLGGKSGETDSEGNFLIKEIPAGKYTLSVNYNSNPDPEKPFPTTFYPSGSDRSRANVFEVGGGSKIDGITWHLPLKLDENAISGKVVWEDGSPAAGVEIRLFDQAFPRFFAGCYLLENRDKAKDVNSSVRSSSFRFTGPACELRSDSNGNFRLSGYAGRTYILSAAAKKTTDGQRFEFSGESGSFSLTGEPASIKLVLRKNN